MKKEEILKVLIEGTNKAQMVVCPKSNLFGFTINQKIIINFYKCAVLFKSIKNLNSEQINLIKTISTLTLFHELTHYLVRGLNFTVKNNYSFI